MLSQDGSLMVTELNFEIVQSLYMDRHAFRENLTDVIIHHFVTEEKGDHYFKLKMATK